MKKYKLVLASQSPQRINFMKDLHIPFEVIPSHEDEFTEETAPLAVTRSLAQLKGESVFNKILKDPQYNSHETAPFVIAADTICAFKGKIIGKPKDRAHAKEILMDFSGHVHHVVTGVYFKWLDYETGVEKSISFEDDTEVFFNSVPESIIEQYLDRNEYGDKAGAYAFQGGAQVFIRKVHGSYSNVIGLPIDLVFERLNQVCSKDGIVLNKFFCK